MNTADHQSRTTYGQDNEHYDHPLPHSMHGVSSQGNSNQQEMMMMIDHANIDNSFMSKTAAVMASSPSIDQLTNNEQRKQGWESPQKGTYETTTFNQILAQYNQRQDLPPTLELTQALLMTSNAKEAATRVTGLTQGGSTSYLRNEMVGEQLRIHNSMKSVSRLASNIGASDLASNYLFQRSDYMRAQARENKGIRDILDDKIVDGIEYVRSKESIAEAKQRVKPLIDLSFTSDEDEGGKSVRHSSENGAAIDTHTQEDSEKTAKERFITENRIANIIKTLREDAREYLSEQQGANFEEMPIPKLFSKLRKNKAFRRKREAKALAKGSIADTLAQTAEQLQIELTRLDSQISAAKKRTELTSKKDLERAIRQYEQVIGLEKRVCQDTFDKTIADVDSANLNSNSYNLYNELLKFCGIDSKEESIIRQKSLRKDLLGNIKKVPLKSSLLQNYYDAADTQKKTNQELIQTGKAQNHELVKVIGLEPDKLFHQLDKYRVQVNKLPTFSNVFERAEPLASPIGMTVPGSTLLQPNSGGHMTFARIDGRSVISLKFNPYFDTAGDQGKKNEYDSAMKEIQDQREKLKNQTKQNREKQEQANIKRAWLNIVKKDLPKAFKQYQKFKSDQENNNKKQSQNCLKEVRKKALKTQRLQKENQLRAKKLTKDMMTFWKKRDKEITDLKRRKEKFEKEMRKRLEEEREMVLQRKRLEFIMQQSEIYAHFMSKKLGLSDELQKQKQQDIDEEQRDSFKRYDIDEKEARHNIASMINDNRSRVNDFDSETMARKHAPVGRLDKIKDDELEVDKFDNPDAGNSSVLNPPRCFLGHLKHYQLKGLRWLDNLYEQGINGILADEMGLGKTIQAIALLAHLYEKKGVWGPFLIIVPCTVLSNWQNELQKFCPTLKVLPFFGSPEERKKLGKFLDPKNLYNPNMRINVLLTSYNLIVNNSKDQMKLLRVKWHYMILDEAQAIKNNLSRRWKVLLQFNARNRLLLTGTPIQNSMAELWALLHFIMPKLFDSHEQFQEWFSKDIEAHSLTDQGEINKHQLRRLHLVLKPFMLRRLKDDIELEIGPKTEFTHTCMMTHRQKVLYQRIKNKISTRDLFRLVESKAKMENLMNLVMQFRKVCNHPELFERRIGRIPLTFKELQVGMQQNPFLQSVPELRTQMRNPITFELPKIVYDECFLVNDNTTSLFKKIGREDDAFSQFGIETHMKFFNIFNTQSLHEGAFKPEKCGSVFQTLRMLFSSFKWSFGEISWLHVADPVIKQIALMHYHHERYHKKLYRSILQDDNKKHDIYRLRLSTKGEPVNLGIVDYCGRDDPTSSLIREYRVYDPSGRASFLPPLITDDLNTFTRFSRSLKNDLDVFVSPAVADPILMSCRSSTFNRLNSSLLWSPMHKKALLGTAFKPRQDIHIGRVGRDKTSFLTQDSDNSYKYGPPAGYQLLEHGVIGDLIKEKGASILELPNYSRLVTDCAKMKFLDQLLGKLNSGKHRVLIFCQMTKMLDILEDFLCWRKYTYFRMDGSTNLQDRRFMVEEFQKNDTIFAFLLSTRAGGLGVNLTAADTVIFYDNDWNPTIDAQAQDRAHRIGQTKPVSVYRLITKGTVEEKIVKRAKQKQTVQSTVYGGNALKADVFRPKDVVDMLLDEDEENDLKERQQKFLRTKRVKKGSRPPMANAERPSEGPFMTVDTSSAATQKKKEFASPAKPTPKRVSIAAENGGGDDAAPQKGKPGRKPSEKPQQITNIFSTIKTNGYGNGHSKASDTPMITVHDDEEDEDEYEDEDDEFNAQQKLLELLEKPDDDDDEEGVAIEYNSGDEGEANVAIKQNKASKGGKANDLVAGGDDAEDEDMMGDEY